jgi:lipopolysaccharide transport system permease protein
VNWKELYVFRELLYFLALRDIKVRYKQTSLGVAWAVLQPLATMLIFTLIFGRFAQIPSDGIPYAVFVFAGLVPWQFFSNSLAIASQCLINQRQFLTKIYFPRIFIPTASVAAFLVDLGISFLIYAVLLLFNGVTPSWQVIFLPVLIILTIVLTLALGIFLSALTVVYRDAKHMVPFMLQFLMYASPVVYPVSIVPDRYQWMLGLNPLCGIIDGYRSAILGTPWNFTTLGLSALISTGLFVFALYYFRRTERHFADIA